MASLQELRDRIECVEQEIASCRQRGQDPSPIVAALEMLKGQAAVLNRDLVSAKAAYKNAAEGFLRAGMDTERATVAMDAADSFSLAGESAAALEFCEQAVAAAGDRWWKISLPDRVHVPEIVVRTFDRAVKLAYYESRFDHVFDYIQKAKSRWLLDVLMLRQIERVFPILKLAGDHAKWERAAEMEGGRLQEALHALDEQWNAYFGGKGSAPRLDGAEAAVLDCYRSAARTMFGGARPSAAASTAQEIQTRLGPADALLDFFVQTEGVYCAVLKKESFRVAYQPFPAAELGRAVRSAYLALIQGERRRVFNLRADKVSLPASITSILYPDPAPVLERLYDLLLRPLAKELAGTKRWVVCPHWSLHILPFHALRVSAGSPEAVVDSRAVSYAPSASIWLRLRELQGEQASADSGSKALVLGVERRPPLDWRARIESFVNDLMGHPKLSDFEAEATDIAGDLGIGAVLGSVATKEEFFHGLATASIVHLSCHSLQRRANPLLDGLVLSDGVLSLTEILMNSRLTGARPCLLSLSACRSGVERIEPGDVFLGSGYGFLARFGCPVLASLWPVDAEATRLLMSEFYRQGKGNNDWASALQQAQCLVKKSRSRPDAEGQSVAFADPYYWAGFFLLGPSAANLGTGEKVNERNAYAGQQ
jgi:CHAT domain-containing protein